jgi:hypothetical protein
MAAAQYNDSPPPGYYAPPPATQQPGYAQPVARPGYYPTQTEYAPPAPTVNLEGFALSIALGYGTPTGDAMKDSSGTSLAMSDVISEQIPFVLGVGFRTNPLFSVGLALQYAPVTTKNCDTGSSCSSSDTRLGVEGRFHFAADQMFSPWISFGLGYEWFSLSETGANTFDMTFKGLDFEFQVGGDFRVSPTFTLGPYLGYRVGTFDSASISSPGSSDASADIPDASQASHGWLTFGLRSAFTL